MDSITSIALLAFSYVLLSRILMSKLVNREYMRKYQEKMKEINKRFVEASKKNDVKELEKLHEIQKKEVIPGMKKMLFEQMKMFIVVIILFTAALHFLPQFDENTKDDITINISANDSAVIKGDSNGVWWLEVKEGDRTKATLKIGVGDYTKEEDLINEINYNGNNISTNKKEYALGEDIIIYNKGENEVHIIADRGTRTSIYIGLPFFERVSGSYGVFIVIVIIGGITFNILEKLFQKFKNKK